MIAAPARILIIRRRAIGDCIVSLDVARAVREQWPDARIAFVVDRPAVAAVEGSPFVDDVIIYDRRDYSSGPFHRRIAATWKWWSRLRAWQPDLVLDLLNTPQTAQWTWWTRAKTRVGPRLRNRTWAYNVVVDDETEKLFAGERFLDWVRALGIDPGPWRPHALPPAASAAEGLSIDRDGRSLVILNAGATWSAKAWPAGHFAELARQLGGRSDVRLAWAPGEETLRDEIVSEAAGAIRPLPPTTITELGAWVSHADLVVTTDSGPKHLAVAMGTRTLTVFGSTEPKGWQPPGKAHRYLTNPIDCHPCDLRDCPVEGHPCLDGLDPLIVAAEAESMLDEGSVHG